MNNIGPAATFTDKFETSQIQKSQEQEQPGQGALYPLRSQDGQAQAAGKDQGGEPDEGRQEGFHFGGDAKDHLLLRGWQRRLIPEGGDNQQEQGGQQPQAAIANHPLAQLRVLKIDTGQKAEESGNHQGHKGAEKEGRPECGVKKS